ncbi:MAG TPA: PIN domain-containing protein [Chthoniobacterales bacterium]|nr:PIN domain-containing protein [Chthoniobacterales bacterium]
MWTSKWFPALPKSPLDTAAKLQQHGGAEGPFTPGRCPRIGTAGKRFLGYGSEESADEAVPRCIDPCLAKSPRFAAADALVTSGAVTSAHALAEAYATLSGDARLKISPADAAQMVGEIAKALQVHALSADAYVDLIEQAPSKGMRGGSIFDAIHAQAARESRCGEIYTLNLRHFQHVAPDLAVKGL